MPAGWVREYVQQKQWLYQVTQPEEDVMGTAGPVSTEAQSLPLRLSPLWLVS